MKMKCKLMVMAIVCAAIPTALLAQPLKYDLRGEWAVDTSVVGVGHHIKSISICRQNGEFVTVSHQGFPSIGGDRLIIGNGRWVRTGAKTFDLEFHAMIGNNVYQRVRGSITLSESGNKLQASGRSDFVDGYGTVLYSFPVTAEGDRLETSRLTAVR